MRGISFIVPGKPKAKGRARSTKSGRHYTPEATQSAEARVLECFLAAHPDHVPFRGPLRLTVTAMFKPAKSWPKRKVAAAYSGELMHVCKPDLDNLIKLAKDALNGVAYVDDSQVVCYGDPRKVYGPREGLEVVIQEIKEEWK